MSGKGYTSVKAGQNAIGKSGIRGIRYTIKLDGHTAKDGARSLRYFPTFEPATAAEREIVTKAGFRCA